ncbi:hypothetical protein M2451_003854 [Dysgonomonas sp. PFB1-18]|uniref:hypothetical protein n=1 Tax=unclassified Dysgonomonas TaxID=2630389 RepID=UPI0024758D0D|nr:MULTISPECIES: hypothetical protein [unclassified Dysgonomonas]MDH6309464.1 hypothetical protein [Dysgonomonas sp. PF1-14]MDH6340874.1 hypothetical protein [Dysgonomonas sp. PF1-16]MDH6382513.1 hypothetical protein [Dysgonomonas sp. PFB1-18]MDH6399843.1 hypothetical protein [Dysgonomonas sp. PF1-23]
MKKLSILFIVFCIVSCSTNESKYEKLISDYVQTDKHGTWTDLDFKIVNLKELPPIKVSDSIAILQQEFEENKAKCLELQESHLKRSQENLEKEGKAKYGSKVITDMYNKHISDATRRIDSVKNLQFVNKYEGISSEKVLLQPVECRYSYVFPPSNPRQERTDIFYFLPDNSKILRQKQIKNK